MLELTGNLKTSGHQFLESRDQHSLTSGVFQWCGKQRFIYNRYLKMFPKQRI